jgi:SAM-dependent methyltransferase
MTLPVRTAMKLRWSLSTLRDWVDYRRRRRAFDLELPEKARHRVEHPVGERTRHVYDIGDGGRAFTTFQMDQRHAIVSRYYPTTLTSLLDIGCCRGWFVLQAAQRATCERALGIDVVPEFITAADEGKRLLGLEDKARFAYAFLDDLENDRTGYGVPYQTLLLINTYHYMFWGSYLSPKHWPDHERLLSSLAGMCTDRMIFMSPLEVAECPSDIGRAAGQHPDWAKQFTEARFLEVANKYFDVKLETHVGLRPLYVMRKR